MYLLFLALIISTLTVFTLVVLFDDISIVTLWQEHKKWNNFISSIGDT